MSTYEMRMEVGTKHNFTFHVLLNTLPLDTPLHVCEDPEASKILLRNGADPLLENYEGKNVR
jgi:hypothetical protein